jgi:hypothetical protein
MTRYLKALRIAGLVALPFVIVAGYVAAKAYHQMHTPIGVLVVDERH